MYTLLATLLPDGICILNSRYFLGINDKMVFHFFIAEAEYAMVDKI